MCSARCEHGFNILLKQHIPIWSVQATHITLVVVFCFIAQCKFAFGWLHWRKRFAAFSLQLSTVLFQFKASLRVIDFGGPTYIISADATTNTSRICEFTTPDLWILSIILQRKCKSSVLWTELWRFMFPSDWLSIVLCTISLNSLARYKTGRIRA